VQQKAEMHFLDEMKNESPSRLKIVAKKVSDTLTSHLLLLDSLLVSEIWWPDRKQVALKPIG